MSGTNIFIGGIGMTVLSLILFITSIIYRKTEGKRILEELQREYE